MSQFVLYLAGDVLLGALLGLDLLLDHVAGRSRSCDDLSVSASEIAISNSGSKRRFLFLLLLSQQQK
jgi:hypothetical protein